MKSFNRYFTNFFYLAIFAGLLTTAFMVGCGGGNNPSGPTVGTADQTTSTGVLPSTATGSITLTGLLINSSTGNLIDDDSATIYVKASLIGTDYTKEIEATKNQAFSIFDLPAGNYLIEVEDRATTKVFNKTSLIKELTEGKVSLSIQLSPVVPDPGRINFFGTLVDSSFYKPIQFVTIKVQSNSGLSFETSTLFDGTFSLQDLASGSYKISFEKSGFETASRSLLISEQDIWIGTKKLDIVNDLKNYTDGSNTPQKGYDLGNIILAPKITETGGISGILLDNSKIPLVNTELDLVYDSNTNDAIPPASIIPSFKTNDLGYFLAKNLPAGWYLVAYPGYQLFPILDASGNTVGYNFGKNGSPDSSVLVTRVWLEVNPGSVTPIPELE
jgi:hypothetical protein